MSGITVVNGSGVSGLVSALLLCERGEGERTVIVERNREPGGLLRCFHYGAWGAFDHGMHNMQETGIRELDDLILGLLPRGDWQMLEGAKRDLAGVYVNGQLQTHTPYIDLRTLPANEKALSITALLDHLRAPVNDDLCTPTTADEYAACRFGRTVADRTVVPAVEKIHQRPASTLDVMATRLTPMTRLACCDETEAPALTASAFFRERIAWPEQRTLPLDRSSGRNSFYPRAYGTYRIVEAIVKRLTDAGVRLLTESEIVGITGAGSRVQSMQVRSGATTCTIDDVRRLVWTSNIPALARHVGVDLGGIRPDKPLKTIVVNLVFDRPPRLMGDLYYFFCYDPRFHTFRLTNYTNYCEGAPRGGGYPIGMEFLMNDEQVAAGHLVERAVDEFRRFQIGDPDTRLLFGQAEILESGFPMPTVNNVSGLRAVREKVRALGLNNLNLVGILAEDNLFFQTDVLAHAYRALR